MILFRTHKTFMHAQTHRHIHIHIHTGGDTLLSTDGHEKMSTHGHTHIHTHTHAHTQGDTLLSIDGHDIGKRSAKEVTTMLRGRVSTPVELAIHSIRGTVYTVCIYVCMYVCVVRALSETVSNFK
jgi:hypothetical protein